jgi:transposase
MGAKGKRRTDVHEQTPKILTLYSQGQSLRQIATAYACSVRTINRIVARHGISRPVGGGRSTRRADVASRSSEIVRSYKEGATLTQLAAVNGCSVSMIHRLVREHTDIRLLPRRHDVYARSNEIVRLYFEEGNSVHKIANIFDCSDNTIKRIIARTGADASGDQ